MGNLTRDAEDRAELAQRRILSVLDKYTVSNMRTLENKISDGGPNDQRIDPHILSAARNELVNAGLVIRTERQNAPWFHLAGASAELVEARLAELVPIHRDYQRLGKRIGQALEIAVFRALRRQTAMHFFGHYHKLNLQDDSTLYPKDEPPSSVSGRTLPGDMKLDFLGLHTVAGNVGIEVKNVREWMYPHRDEITDLLIKCTSIDAVPVLIARRIQYSTFRVLHKCGLILHQQFNQLLPETAQPIADKARDKNLLGYHDVRLGNQPDARLVKFITTDLPAVLPEMRERFDHYKDLLFDYGNRTIGYEEFAARARRRSEGRNEDFDE